ncbi:hypothetical protein YT1_0219 [Rhodococcus ruber]|nr:hypothetical protein YT1_0219 [Rhodococcus ruber]CCW12465.1 hypothetical protein EBESD8_30140 [Rhodococcus aetherivorans]
MTWAGVTSVALAAPAVALMVLSGGRAARSAEALAIPKAVAASARTVKGSRDVGGDDRGRRSGPVPDPPPGTSASILSTAHYIGMFIIGIPLIWCSHIINWCSKVCA